MTGSKISSILTLEYITTEHENKYFDRKSAQIKPSDLAQHISAFANADGGAIVIGISDKTMKLEGINDFGENKINDFINAPKNFCIPMPKFQEEFLEITNYQGKPDRLLLLHIKASADQIIRTSSDRTFLRIGDRTDEMRGDNLRNLEYAKNTRHYEDECNADAKISDLDPILLAEYKERINATDLDDRQVLLARGFIRELDGKVCLTNAAVLLFAKNIQQFYPNCRVRFVRYDGSSAKVGENINITRDYNVEEPLPRLIEKARDFISTQLREFTSLDGRTGRFQVVPEYPEFAWLEGVVNAVTHRQYSMSGRYIKVSMYDDRLEIESPGDLPYIVTVENIRHMRYSRNPKISRVLTEFGWVRELNEGVRRIYADMESFFLDDPVFSDKDNTVTLTLYNNIIVRKQRQEEYAASSVGVDNWAMLDDLEQQLLTFIVNHGPTGRAKLAEYVGKSYGTVINRIKHLMELGLVKANGSKYDPTRKYEAISDNFNAR